MLIKTDGGDAAETVNCIDEISGGGYIVVGNACSEPTGAVDRDIKLMKVTLQ